MVSVIQHFNSDLKLSHSIILLINDADINTDGQSEVPTSQMLSQLSLNLRLLYLSLHFSPIFRTPFICSTADNIFHSINVVTLAALLSLFSTCKYYAISNHSPLL